MIAVVLVGTEVSDLGELVSRRFAVFLSVCIYLLIGPLFALPRTGSVSFELAVRPYLSESNVWWVSLIVTGIFRTDLLSERESEKGGESDRKIPHSGTFDLYCPDFSGMCFHGKITAWPGSVWQHRCPRGAYAEIPFFQGMIEGYYALDGPAGLVFAIIIINAVRGFQVHEKKNIIKYTLFCGAGAALILSVVYYMLTYIGAVTQTPFSNGGTLLHAVASDLLGPVGGIVLGVAVFFACMTTSIGLTTSFADYFHELFPNMSYKKITAIVCLFSFVISNIGLDMLVQVSLPVLMMIYPVTVVLVILSFFKKWIGNRKMVYVLGMLFAFCVAFVDGMQSVKIMLGPVTEFCRQLRFMIFGLAGSYRQWRELCWDCCQYGNITENERFYNLTE